MTPLNGHSLTRAGRQQGDQQGTKLQVSRSEGMKRHERHEWLLEGRAEWMQVMLAVAGWFWPVVLFGSLVV